MGRNGTCHHFDTLILFCSTAKKYFGYNLYLVPFKLSHLLGYKILVFDLSCHSIIILVINITISYRFFKGNFDFSRDFRVSLKYIFRCWIFEIVVITSGFYGLLEWFCLVYFDICWFLDIVIELILSFI